MTTIDNKIVYVGLDSKDFEDGTKKVLSNIEALKQGLSFKDAGKGLSELNQHVSAFSLQGIADNVKNISSHFSALGAIGFTVLQNLTNGAIAFGKQVVQKVLAPIIEGGRQRALNIENAKFQFRALGQNVDAMMKSSLDAVRGTAFGLDEAAKAAGQFGAAGIHAGAQMTGTLRGVAGVAAVTNSSFSDISQIFTTIAGAGKINSEQLYQFATRGLNVAAALGKQWHMTEQQVRSLASQGKISFKMFAKAMDQAFGAHAKEANQTYQGALENMQAAMARIGADAWTPFLHAQRDVMNALTPFIDKVHEAIMPMIDLFGKTAQSRADRLIKIINGANLTGLTKGMPFIADGFKNLLKIVNTIGKTMGAAFREVFPPKFTETFISFSKGFKSFTESLKPSATTLENLKRTFAGLFAILDIGKQILAGIFSVFGEVFKAISDNSGGFLDFTGGIGDWLVAVDKALKKGQGLQNFFKGLGAIIATPLRIIASISHAISGLFAGFTPGAFSAQFDKATKSMSPFAKALIAVGNALGTLLKGFGNLGNVMQPVIDGIVKFLLGIGPAISKTIASANFQGILEVIKTGLLGGLVLMFKQFLGRGSLIQQITGPKGFVGGIAGNISNTFKALAGSMKALQQNIQAKTLKEIAIAVALLTASVVALSLVNTKKLGGALAAMSVAFGELLGSMYILTNVTKTQGFIKLPIITASLILLAGACDLLSLAVIGLSSLDWQGLLKGLGGVAALLGGLVAVSGPLSANSAGMIKAGVGITAMAIGIRIMANAVAAMGGLSLLTIAKGLGGIAIAMTGIIFAMKAMPGNMVVTGAGLIAVSVGLRIIANVVQEMGGLSLKTIAKGLLGIGGALVIIAGAMKIMPNMTRSAAGLLLVSVALKIIASALAKMGGMSIAGVAKSLITLAGALLILTVAMDAMQGLMAGAAALAIVSAGILLLSKALIGMGKMSWTSIIKGLIALAAALAIIIVAGAALTPVTPAILGFGAALALIGAGLALAGAGIFLIASGLSALIIAIPTALGILEQALQQAQAATIENVKNLVQGFLLIVQQISKVAPQFVAAIAKILLTVVDAVIKIAPKLGEAITILLGVIIKVLADNQDRIVKAGFDLVVAILKGIANNIPAVVRAAVDIVINVLKAISGQYVRILKAGVDIVTNLLKGIISAYSKVISAAVDLIARFVRAIASNLGKIASAGLGLVTALVNAIANNVGKLVTAGTNIVVHFLNGIGNAGSRIITAGTNMIIKLMNALQSNSNKLANAGANAVIRFLNGVADTIRTKEPQLLAAGANIGKAIVQGMINGMGSLGGQLASKAESLISSIPGKAKKLLHLGSPSKVFHDIGQNIIQGLINGMTSTNGATKAAEEMSNGIIETFKTVFGIHSPSKVMYDIGQFVGQGFAQGLHGSADDINGAFQDLNGKISDGLQQARQTISSEQDKRASLDKKSKSYGKDLREINKTIAEQNKVIKSLTATHTQLVNGLSDEKKRLIGLSKDYDDVANRLEDAKKALDDAKQTRADAIQSYIDQYDKLPDIISEDANGTKVDQLKTYMDSLINQTKAVGQYNATLQQLRKLGLDDATYKKLLEEGTGDQAFANQILAGGKSSVAELNKLDSQLQNVSKSLGKSAGNNLYDAGVQAAQGLVDGLASRAKYLQQVMDKVADGMVASLKKKLGIKSPSQVFAEIGTQSMQGMAQGFTDSSSVVTDAVDAAAQDAMDQMRQSMSDISSVISDSIDPNLVITPVLDLTKVRGQMGELAALTTSTPITASVSNGQANAISSMQGSQGDQTNVAPGGTVVKFEQNNYSPEALTEIEIYRQTKNQLSQIKSTVGLT